MSNEMAPLPTQLPAYLQKQKGVVDEFAGGTSTGLPLPVLSVRGKELRIRKDGQEMNTRLRDVEVIMVAARGGTRMSKRYYDKPYEAGSVEAPRCSSADGITPDVPNPINPNCTDCPFNQFGSKISETGKETKKCGDYKRIVVWPVGLGQGIDTPVMHDLSATNVRYTKDQRSKTADMDYTAYIGMLKKHGLDPTDVVTRIEFTDADYPQFCFKFSRLVSEQEFVRINEMRQQDEVKEVLEADVHETPTTTTEAPQADPQQAAQPVQQPTTPEPAPTPQPEQPQADPQPAPEPAKPAFEPKRMMDPETGEVIVVKSKGAYIAAIDGGYELAPEDEPAPAPEPQAEQPAPAPEPEPPQQGGPDPQPAPQEAAQPQPATQQPAEGGDLLAQLNSLLSGSSQNN